ncbi:MAG: hypothetical protein ACREOK_01260 [Gemmatimonadaceae bacterium]
MPGLEEVAYDGFVEKVKRLGLEPLLNEARGILRDFELRVLEKKDANGGAALREIIDARFHAALGWTKIQTGGIDWTKCHRANGTEVCLGIEIQVSARSDMLVIDIQHLREALTEGKIDAAVLVVPSDTLGSYLTDRAPCLKDAKRHMEVARATDLPFVLFGLAHDGPGEALPKRYRRTTPRR